MIQKNREKVDRKERRKPPIPFTRMTPTKREKELKIEKKHRRDYANLSS